MNAKPQSTTTRFKRTGLRRETLAATRRRIARRVAGARLESRCHLGTLDEFQRLHVCTLNSLYGSSSSNRTGDVRVAAGGISGVDRGRLAGCTAGGSFLKRLAINVGLQMEFEIDRRRIVTSPVRSVAILQKTLPA
jgi:hypothetical protein